MKVKPNHFMLHLSRDKPGHRDIAEIYRGQLTEGEEDLSNQGAR